MRSAIKDREHLPLQRSSIVHYNIAQVSRNLAARIGQSRLVTD